MEEEREKGERETKEVGWGMENVQTGVQDRKAYLDISEEDESLKCRSAPEL